VQSSSQIITNNKPTSNFLQARCPSCHQTNSVKALKGKYHIRAGLENKRTKCVVKMQEKNCKAGKCGTGKEN